MSIKTVKFPFTSFNGVEAFYSLELQGYVSGFEIGFFFKKKKKNTRVFLILNEYMNFLFFFFQLTREEFENRIRELNETSKNSRSNRFFIFLPLFIILLAIAIILPLVFSRQVSNVSNNFNFEE